MANFLREFNTHAEYTAFTESEEYVTPNVSTCKDEDDVHYNPYVYNPANEYFTTVAKSNGSIIFNGSTTANALSYSKDDGATWSTTAQTPTVNVNAGDKVLWKGNCQPTGSGIGMFISGGSATFDVEGNVMSLIYGDNFKGQTSLEGMNDAFTSLFNGNTKVISAENLSLPATTLAKYCYFKMFNGCKSLTSAPVLPAMTLAYGCYQGMFSGCSILESAPELPAMTLAKECYAYMFQYCNRLTSAPELPVKTLADSCYQYMFNCCTNLTTAPVLPATTLVYNCYGGMFGGCRSLNSITCLATNISANAYTASWVDGVARTGTFTKAASTSWSTGIHGIPDGWSVQTA